MKKIQQEFEAWAIEHHFSTTKKQDGASYAHDSTMCAFEGWKASRSALCVILPTARNIDESNYKECVMMSIDNAGVSYK